MIIKVVAFLFLFMPSTWAKIPEIVQTCLKDFSLGKIEETKPHYAEGFRYYKKGAFTVVQSQGQFWLLSPDAKIKGCSALSHFIIPFKKVIAFSTTHLSFIKLLNKQNTLCGFAGIELVNDISILDRYRKGEVKELGYPLQEELLVSLKPDGIFTFAVQSNDERDLQRQKKLGLPIISLAEYKEKTPLARAEWLILMGLFYNQESQAKEVFQKQERDYLNLTQKIKKTSKHPQVILGELRNGVWYAPGGESDLARLVGDAGANYLWKDRKGKSFITLSFEEVLQTLNKNVGVVYWLPQNNWRTIQEVIHADPRYQSLGVINKTKIFNYNLKRNSKGYSDYWETGISNPDLLLKDLVSIFNPEILGAYQRLWYWEIKN